MFRRTFFLLVGGEDLLMGVEVRRVTKALSGIPVLDGVSLSIPRGTVTALVGASGSGKSTLLRVIAGVEAPDTGEVVTGGRVAFVSSRALEGEDITVRDAVSRDVAPSAADDVLRSADLTGLADRTARSLSDGERQRLAVAMAVAGGPRVLVADDLFAGLDASSRARLSAWLRHVHDGGEVTIVFSTHDQQEALDLAEYIVVLAAGRIVQSGGPDEVYDSPSSPQAMGAVGFVSQVGDRFVRPHDIDIHPEPVDDGLEAQIERVARVGSEARVETHLADGQRVVVLVPRQQAAELELEPGQIVWLRPHLVRRFGTAASDPAPV